MSSHECVLCAVYRRKPVVTDGTPCDSCYSRLKTQLAAIPVQYAMLDATPGSNTGEKVRGSAEPNLKVRIAVLDLLLPANQGTVTDSHGDQTGSVSVATALDCWVTDWAELRGQGEHGPGSTVAAMCAWLADRVDWAFDHHPAVEDFASTIANVLTTLRGVTGDVIAKPIHKDGVPCPRCDFKSLYETSDYVECLEDKGGCGRLLNPPEYHQWVRLEDHYLRGNTPCPLCETEALHADSARRTVECMYVWHGCGAVMSQRAYEDWAVRYHRGRKKENAETANN